jgi:hypothetical protein
MAKAKSRAIDPTRAGSTKPAAKGAAAAEAVAYPGKPRGFRGESRSAVDGRWASGKVLGFFIVGFQLERPPGGGAVRQTLKVEGLPKGTKALHPWLMHHEYRFFDPTSGQAVERPLWIQFTDLYAYEQGGDWYLQVTGGWADKGDKSPWEGFIGVIAIATA